MEEKKNQMIVEMVEKLSKMDSNSLTIMKASVDILAAKERLDKEEVKTDMKVINISARTGKIIEDMSSIKLPEGHPAYEVILRAWENIRNREKEKKGA